MLHNWKSTLVTLALVILAGSQALAIQRVAPKFGVWELRGGSVMPTGSNTGTILQQFRFEDRLYDIDAESIYENGFAIGIRYSRLVGAHWSASLGFQYIASDFVDTIITNDGSVGFYQAVETPDYRQYDLQLSLDYLVLDIRKRFWSPQVGTTLSLGFGSAEFEGFQDEYQANMALGLNFGLEIKLWREKTGRSFVTLASINSWDFLSTGDRPTYLQIGGGIKYYFKP